jgi:hypothetical protein
MTLLAMAATTASAGPPGSLGVADDPMLDPKSRQQYQPVNGFDDAEPVTAPAGSVFGSTDRRATEPVPGKILRYVDALIRKHDSEGDGVLSEQEWRGAAGNPQAADIDHDGIITPEELIERIAVYSRHRSLRLVRPTVNEPLAKTPVEGTTGVDASIDPMHRPDGGQGLAGSEHDPSGETSDADIERARELARRSRKFYIPRDRLPAGTPNWFIDRDADGDGQITMREFSAKWSPEVAAEFASYDRNGDGVVTAAESAAGGNKTTTESATALDAASRRAPVQP